MRGILFLILGFSLAISPIIAFAHSGETHTLGNFTIEETHTPLSPFVHEEVQISFVLENEDGSPAKEVPGEIVIKQLTISEYVGQDSIATDKIIFREPATTDASGNVGLTHTFSQQGTYDVEFYWGDDQKQSTGKEIQVRDPASFFAPEELQKRIWLFIGIFLGGIVVGAIGAIILMTTSLHPKK